jgi:hypothetical protein
VPAFPLFAVVQSSRVNAVHDKREIVAAYAQPAYPPRMASRPNASHDLQVACFGNRNSFDWK